MLTQASAGFRKVSVLVALFTSLACGGGGAEAGAPEAGTCRKGCRRATENQIGEVGSDREDPIASRGMARKRCWRGQILLV